MFYNVKVAILICNFYSGLSCFKFSRWTFEEIREVNVCNL